MKTLVKTSMIIGMALAIVFMTVPFGYTQEVTTPKTVCAKCGVVTTVDDCSYGPGLTRVGPTTKPGPRLGNEGCGKQKPALTSHNGESIWFRGPRPATEPVRAFGQSPAWPEDNGAATVCPNCGNGFGSDERLRQVGP